MEAQILINEIHPSPTSGSEWIELWLTNETEAISLEGFSIFDNTRQIYEFTNEHFINQLLVIELSGLNNDGDSVILKNTENETLDSFTYDKTEKGLSWSRCEPNNTFILTSPSRNLINPTITNSPTPIATPTVNLTPTLTPTLTQIITNSPTPAITPNTKPSEKPLLNAGTKELHQKYDLSKIKLNDIDEKTQERTLRLVFIGEQLGQTEIMNVIIGSFLIILSASFLLYVKIKNKHH